MKLIQLAKIVVVNQNDEVLVLQSGDWPEKPERSHAPDMPGGTVEEGEAFEQAIVRELLEETGIDIEIKDVVPFYADSNVREDTLYVRVVYVTRIDDPVVTLSWEHEKFWWMPMTELHTLKIRDPYPNIFKILCDNDILSLV